MRFTVATALLLSLCVSGACSREDAAEPAVVAEAPTGEPGAASMPWTNAGYTYTCAGGLEFNARIEKGNAIVTLDGKTLTLAPIVGSGAQYEGEGVIFVARGNEATLMRADQRPLTCTAK